MGNKKNSAADPFDAAFKAYIGMKPGDAEPHEYAPPAKFSQEEKRKLSAVNLAFSKAVEAGLSPAISGNLPALMNPMEGIMMGDILDVLRVTQEQNESMDSKNVVYLVAASNDICATVVERAYPGTLQALVPAAMATEETADLLKKFDLPALEKLARGAIKGPKP